MQVYKWYTPVMSNVNNIIAYFMRRNYHGNLSDTSCYKLNKVERIDRPGFHHPSMYCSIIGHTSNTRL